MIVEINLLGKPEKRNLAPYVSIAIILLLALVLGIFGFMKYINTNSEIKVAEQKLKTTQQLIEIEGKRANTVKQTSALDELKATIAWAEAFPTPTVYLISNLTSLLPERGYIMNFSYSDDGNVDLSVQTDTSREIAYYLKSLLDSPYLSQVTIKSITTKEPQMVQLKIEDYEVKEEKLEGDYVPRYVGQFQLTVNKQALKLDAAKEENNQ